MTKITKKDIFTALLEAAEHGTISLPDEITQDDVAEFCAKEIASLERKAETARAKAAEKKAAGDELRERVAAILTAEPMTIAEVTEALGDPDISSNKIAYRLNSLCDIGVAEKNDARIVGSDGKSRIVKVFALKQA